MSISTRPSVRRAFSLMEMLVVLLILTVVISIVVPALRHFRDSARKSATQQMMASLATAVGQFRLSNNRLPGYFSPKQMGDPNNAMSGGSFGSISSMESVMLDLAGGVTTDTPAGMGDPCMQGSYSVVEVGPSNDHKVRVDLGRIGAAETGGTGNIKSAYFKPDPKYFARQCTPNQREGIGANDPRGAMPVLVDAWGSPILAWVQDDVPSSLPFSSRDSGTARARFYSASNRCFTSAARLGRIGADQTDADLGSVLGSTHFTPDAQAQSLQGLLGNPAFPGEARGPMVFHSAGRDGIYLGRGERGGKVLTGTGGNSPLATPVGVDYFQEGFFNDFILRAE
jgi:prepilin-type N-terminal cleavage/methylation domain-containing protein